MNTRSLPLSSNNNQYANVKCENRTQTIVSTDVSSLASLFGGSARLVHSVGIETESVWQWRRKRRNNTNQRNTEWISIRVEATNRFFHVLISTSSSFLRSPVIEQFTRARTNTVKHDDIVRWAHTKNEKNISFVCSFGRSFETKFISFVCLHLHFMHSTAHSDTARAHIDCFEIFSFFFSAILNFIRTNGHSEAHWWLSVVTHTTKCKWWIISKRWIESSSWPFSFKCVTTFIFRRFSLHFSSFFSLFTNWFLFKIQKFVASVRGDEAFNKICINAAKEKRPQRKSQRHLTETTTAHFGLLESISNWTKRTNSMHFWVSKRIKYHQKKLIGFVFLSNFSFSGEIFDEVNELSIVFSLCDCNFCDYWNRLTINREDTN